MLLVVFYFVFRLTTWSRLENSTLYIPQFQLGYKGARHTKFQPHSSGEPISALTVRPRFPVVCGCTCVKVYVNQLNLTVTAAFRRSSDTVILCVCVCVCVFTSNHVICFCVRFVIEDADLLITAIKPVSNCIILEVRKLELAQWCVNTIREARVRYAKHAHWVCRLCMY